MPNINDRKNASSQSKCSKCKETEMLVNTDIDSSSESEAVVSTSKKHNKSILRTKSQAPLTAHKGTPGTDAKTPRINLKSDSKSQDEVAIDLTRWNLRNYNLFHAHLPLLEAEPAQIQAWFLTWFWPNTDSELRVCTQDKHGNKISRINRAQPQVPRSKDGSEGKEERLSGRLKREVGAQCFQAHLKDGKVGQEDQSEPEVLSVMESVRLTGVDVRIMTMYQLRAYLGRCGFDARDAEWLAIDVDIAKDEEMKARKVKAKEVKK